MTPTKQSEIERPSRKATNGGSPPGPARRARLQRPRELWGRRSVAIGAVLVGAALIGGIILLIAGGGDNGGGSSSAATPQQATKQLQDKFLKHTVVLPDDGISVRRPASWKDSKNNGVITLRSADRCVAVNLSAPTDANGAKGLSSDSLSALKQGYKNVQVSPAGRAQVGGIPTTSKSVTLTDANGGRRRVILSTGTGKKNAYLTEVVLGNPSCAADLAMAQIVLTSVQYTK
jgi:hypothetical protein